VVIFDALVAGHVRRRGLRALVTVVAIALGIAMWVTLRLADAHASASFSAQSGVFGDEADFSVVPNVGTLDGAVLSRVRNVAGVSSATPAREGQAVVAGEVVHVSGRDLLGPLPRTIEFRSVLPGPFAPIGSGPDPGLLLDRGGAFFSDAFARRHRLRVGDGVVASAGLVRVSLIVSAIVPRGAILESNVVLVDVATAARLFGGVGRLDRVDAVARLGKRDAVLAGISRVVPRGAVVVSAGQRRTGVERMAGGFSFDLELLGSVALLAAIVLAMDSVSISVVQRRAEIGTLRVLGATRGAIARTFLIEGVLLGAVGGLLGTVAGTALGDAGGSVAAGTDALVADPLAPAFGILAGTALGTFGALPAAVAAASLPPDRALRNRPDGSLAAGALRTLAWVGAGLLVASVVALGIASAVPATAALAGGIACVGFAAAVVLALPWVVVRTVRIAATRGAGTSAPLDLALANVRAAPRRSALGVAASTFGVALASAALALSASFGAGIATWAASAFRGDLAVTPLGGATGDAAGFSPADVARVAALADVVAVRATRTVDVPFAGARVRVSNAGRVAATASDDGTLDVAIDSTFAAREDLRPGSSFSLPVPEGSRRARVARVLAAGPFDGGTIVLDPRAFARAYRDETADTLEVTLRPTADDARATARVRAALGPRAVDARATRDLRARLLARFEPVVAETVAIATLALVLGALGILTTVTALALERRDDIRLLRVAGLSRAGVRAMIALEAAMLGAAGGAAGILLGLTLAAVALAVDRLAYGWAIALVVPVARLLGTFLVSVALAALAGSIPARFASRLATGRGARTTVAIVALAATVAHAAEVARAFVPHDAAERRAPSDVWRVLGHVRAADGSRYHVATTFFRYDLGDPRAARSNGAFDAAALSIVDEGARRTTTGIRVDREAYGLARASVASDIDIRIDDWSVRVARDRPARIHLHVGEGDVVFDADMRPLGAPVAVAPIEDRSTVACATCLRPGYASARLATRGRLLFGGRRVPVTGLFWIDREHRTSSAGGRDDPSWRFTLQLDDGRVVFIRALRRRDRDGDVDASGFVLAANGTVTYLSNNDVELSNAVATSWRDPRGISYPSLFEAIVPRLRLDFALVPVVQDQEIDGAGRGEPFYDGALDVERAHPGPRDRGSGYVELTGYAGSIRPSP
jgi:putative ABC transport system permease protein